MCKLCSRASSHTGILDLVDELVTDRNSVLHRPTSTIDVWCTTCLCSRAVCLQTLTNAPTLHAALGWVSNVHVSPSPAVGDIIKWYGGGIETVVVGTLGPMGQLVFGMNVDTKPSLFYAAMIPVPDAMDPSRYAPLMPWLNAEALNFLMKRYASFSFCDGRQVTYESALIYTMEALAKELGCKTSEIRQMAKVKRTQERVAKAWEVTRHLPLLMMLDQSMGDTMTTCEPEPRGLPGVESLDSDEPAEMEDKSTESRNTRKYGFVENPSTRDECTMRLTHDSRAVLRSDEPTLAATLALLVPYERAGQDAKFMYETGKTLYRGNKRAYVVGTIENLVFSIPTHNDVAWLDVSTEHAGPPLNERAIDFLIKKYARPWATGVPPCIETFKAVLIRALGTELGCEGSVACIRKSTETIVSASVVADAWQRVLALPDVAILREFARLAAAPPVTIDEAVSEPMAVDDPDPEPAVQPTAVTELAVVAQPVDDAVVTDLAVAYNEPLVEKLVRENELYRQMLQESLDTGLVDSVRHIGEMSAARQKATKELAAAQEQAAKELTAAQEQAAKELAAANEQAAAQIKQLKCEVEVERAQARINLQDMADKLHLAGGGAAEAQGEAAGERRACERGCVERYAREAGRAGPEARGRDSRLCCKGTGDTRLPHASGRDARAYPRVRAG